MNAVRISIILMLAGLPLMGQNAEITGRITDASGGVVPGAAVAVTNEGTGVTRRAQTNVNGYYTVPLLNPGSYSVAVNKQGFKSVTRSGVRLEVDQVSRLDFMLDVGQLSEKIEVTAEAPLVESETSSGGQIIHTKTISEMPLNGRNTWDLTALSGAVFEVGAPGGVGEVPLVSMAGSRIMSQALSLDGGGVQKSGLAQAKAELAPLVDAVSEFKVITNNYAAEYGRTAGGVLTAVTKSGTNEFHGDLWEFDRNNALAARNFFAGANPPLHYNQYGGTVGGPIRRNKTFFFAALEILDSHSNATTVLTLPDAAQRAGNFSGTLNAKGQVIPIYNPFTTRPSPTSPSLFIRDPFAGNIIPASLIDPVAAKAVSYYPLPNQAGSITGASNYNINLGNNVLQYHGTMRVDHEVSSRDRIFGRFVEQHQDFPESSAYPEPAASGIGANSRAIVNTALTWLGDWTHTFSPTVINEFRVGGTYQNRNVIHASYGGDWPKKLGLNGVPQDTFPIFAPAGYSNLGSANAFRHQTNPYYQFIDSLNYFRRNHNLKFGFEYRHDATTDLFLKMPSGQFTFAAAGSGLEGNTATGNGMAAFLLGFATQLQLDGTPGFFFHSYYFGGYAQDDWKISPRLTLNLGIRYDVETPRTSSDNTISSFNPTKINPVAGVPGVVTFAGLNGTPTSLYDIPWTDFAPRLGLAWRPFGGERFVVRAGFGVFFGNPNDNGFDGADGVLGFATNVLMVSPDQNQTAAVILKNGVPPYQQSGPQFRNDSFGVGGPVDFWERNRHTPYTLQSNFGLQHQWKSILLEAKYLGTFGRHLSSLPISMNQILPSQLGGAGTQSQRPFPQFTNVTIDYPAFGSSSYHALALRAERRYNNGFQFLVNYTYSKFMDNVNGVSNNTDPSYEDYYNRRLDKARSSFDVPSLFSTNVIYELPFGRGKQWLKSGAASWIIGGWEISTLGFVHSGQPFGVTTQTNTCLCFSAGPQRANLIGDVNLPAGQQSINEWFNTAAFGQPALYRFGTAGRTVGRGPGTVNFDTGVLRNFPIRERMRLQFRGELFNVLNHPNFGEPGTSLGGPNFGVITTAGPARIIQLALKLYY
jgi:hypothetical protein